LTSGEFQRRAAETLDISRATFYRLLERGRHEWLFRQRATDEKWIRIQDRESLSQKVTEEPNSLPDQLEGLADAALSET
jgi:predicted DNA-binding protein (UPF0251 family)